MEGQTLYCVRQFPDFVDSIAFVNKLVEPAQAGNHHPNLENSDNKVKIILTTHDAGG